jgi:D-arginine dehydrogenase
MPTKQSGVSLKQRKGPMMAEKSGFDAIIIGCGIAGASLAYFLAERGMEDILILEREEQPGYHATGRSAAVLVEFDLVPSVQQLKILGAKFLRNPPEEFSENPLLRPSGILVMAKADLWELAQQKVPRLRQEGVALDLLSQEETLSIVPVVSPANFEGALFFPEDGHLDVHELLWSYLRNAKRRGTTFRSGEEVKALKVGQGRCEGVITGAGEYHANWVIDAAGAWAGEVRAWAGRSPVQLTPYRRTIITFAAPEGLEVKSWPLAADLSHEFYFSPESGGLLASPMDEEPMEPCDARPDDLVVAEAIERLSRLAPRLVPKSIIRKWAGLRTFPVLKGFFWLSGQGGAGIETSPAVGQIASDLILEGQTTLMDVNPISPRRFSK